MNVIEENELLPENNTEEIKESSVELALLSFMDWMEPTYDDNEVRQRLKKFLEDRTDK